MALIKFILEERNYSSVWAGTDFTRCDPLTWPIKHTYSNPGHKYELSLKVTLAQSEQRLNSSPKKVNSRLLGGTLPQFWNVFIWLTPGYGHLSLEAPLCWEQLNHTKDSQPNNTRKLG